jgi:hypothetical protein
MQNAIHWHLAVFISPFVLLLPLQFHSLAVRRDYLIGVSYITFVCTMNPTYIYLSTR